MTEFTLPILLPQATQQALILRPVAQENTTQNLLRLVQAHSYLLSRDKAQAHKTLILDNPSPGAYVLGMLDPRDVDALEALARHLKTRTVSLTCQRLEPMEFDVAFRNAYEGAGAEEHELKAAARQERLWSEAGDAPTGAGGGASPVVNDLSTVIDLTDQSEFARNLSRPEAELTTREFARLALREFVNAGASDLHAECSNEGGRIRFRCDGVLFSRWNGIPLTRMREICSALAQMARVEAAQMRFTRQDATINLRILKQGQPVTVEFRFSSVPALPQPEVVLRSQSQVIKEFDLLGLLDFQLEALHEAIKEPQGIILVTGPTGSGKTNTLEAIFTELSRAGDTKIIEIADPPEIVSAARTQIPVTQRNSWMEAFHSCLRQDPEVIAVGELRSKDAVSVALDAALTGHLVLATFHTTDIEKTFTRLSKLEIPADLLADALNAIHAQRLVRVLCPECKRVDEKGSRSFNKIVYTPGECPVCFHTGWKGRTAIGEVLLMREEVKDWVRAGHPPARIVAQAREQKWLLPMKDVARFKVMAGITSLTEVQRVMRLTAEDVEGRAQQRPASYYQEGSASSAPANGVAAPLSAPDDFADDYIDAEWEETS